MMLIFETNHNISKTATNHKHCKLGVYIIRTGQLKKLDEIKHFSLST